MPSGLKWPCERKQAAAAWEGEASRCIRRPHKSTLPGGVPWTSGPARVAPPHARRGPGVCQSSACAPYIVNGHLATQASIMQRTATIVVSPEADVGGPHRLTACMAQRASSSVLLGVLQFAPGRITFLFSLAASPPDALHLLCSSHACCRRVGRHWPAGVADHGEVGGE